MLQNMLYENRKITAEQFSDAFFDTTSTSTDSDYIKCERNNKALHCFHVCNYHIKNDTCKICHRHHTKLPVVH